MGLLVFVYRNANGDTTNDGVSSREDQLIVENVDGPFVTEVVSGLELSTDRFGNLRLTPTDLVGKNPMFGGNFAGTSDSRWSRELENRVGYNARVVPIFDRVE